MADSDKKTAEQKAAEALQDSYIEKKHSQYVKTNTCLKEFKTTKSFQKYIQTSTKH